jgi:hypothetical protein
MNLAGRYAWATLRPLGLAMAGPDVRDPYKD